MKRTLFAAFVGLASVASPALAQEEAAVRLAPAVVAVVDVTRVSDESLLGKALAAELRQLQETLEVDLGERRTRVEAGQSEFQEMVSAFEAQREELTDAEAQLREADLRARQQALQDLFGAAQVDVQAAQRRLQNETARLMGVLEQEIRPHLGALAEELGIGILLPMSQTVLTQNDLDITDLVIARVDSAYQARNEGTP